MEHVESDVLALVALGEPVSDVERAHLSTCARCAAEVESLTAVVAVGRAVRPSDAPVAPSPAVWDRIRAELELPGGSTHPATHGSVPDLSDRSDWSERSAVVVPLRRRLVPWVVGAAASGILVGSAAGAWWASQPDGGVAPGTDVVAEVALDPLPGQQASGDARVEVAEDGARTLVVSLEGGGTGDGYREVWLIDRDVTRLVSLGVLTGTGGRFTVPPGLDLGEFPVVDVSDEPLDGDPSHSGQSIIRGVLDA